jgi:hypothetical protein
MKISQAQTESSNTVLGHDNECHTSLNGREYYTYDKTSWIQ